MRMQPVYIVRDAAGHISALSAEPGTGTEAKTLDDPEVVTFLQRLDIDLVRVLEDVIGLLTARGLLRFTDLPASAREKLLFRKNLRSQWRAVPNPLGDEDGLI